MQNIVGGNHTIKWGFECNRNSTTSTPFRVVRPSPMPLRLVRNADGTPLRNTNGDSNVDQRFAHHQQLAGLHGSWHCHHLPDCPGVARALAIPGATLAALGLTVNPVATAITTAEAFR